MNTFTKIILAGVLLAGVVYGVFYMVLDGDHQTKIVVTNFDECSEKYPVLESYPRQCMTPDGLRFVEEIGNILSKHDLVRLSDIQPGDSVVSPVKISGEARGYWFFEASFPVKIYDSNDVLLGVSVAQAQGDWMTEDFVPFETVLTFDSPSTKYGKLVIEKDNPSGLPENDDYLWIPIKF